MKGNRITEEEFLSVKQIYHNILFAHSDYLYLSKPVHDMAKMMLLDYNRVFFSRIKFYLFHFIVSELFKLFNSREEYSIQKFINNEISYNNENNISSDESKELRILLNSKSNKRVIDLISNIRNKFSAHLDPDRYQKVQDKLNLEYINETLKILEDFMRIFSLIIEKKDYQSPVNENRLGYRLHECVEKIHFKNP